MTITDFFQKLTAGEMAGWAVVLLILLMSLIEISPIKLNPWEKFFGWIGKKMNGEVDKRLKTVEKQISDMWVNQHRQTILTFAREARSGITHSPDEWANVLNQSEEYEKYIKDHGLSNGIVTQDTVYIRSLYQEMSREHKI